MSAALCLVALGVLVLTLLVSFTRISPTEMGLKSNHLSQSVSNYTMVNSGIYFIGPFTTLIRYPKTLQTFTYDKSDHDLLDGRTSDGLPLILGISFQYRLDPTKLYDLYTTFGANHKLVYHRVGTHLITEIATRFTAYQFFNEKQVIAKQMQQQLNSYFLKNMFATVESLQITEDDLPQAFLDAILNAATTKQNITRTQKLLDSERITFETNLIVAKNKANQTISQSKGQQSKILQESKAAAAIARAYINAETAGYGIIQHEMKLNGDQLLDYIYYDSLGGGGIGGTGTFASQVFVGVNPATYISR